MTTSSDTKTHTRAVKARGRRPLPLLAERSLLAVPGATAGSSYSLPSHLLGDLANSLSLLLTGAFLVAILLRPSLFAESYLRAGFCVSFAATAYNSHALCFYADAFFTVLLGVLCSTFSDSRLARVRTSYLGILGHGIGHLALYLSPDAIRGSGETQATTLWVLAALLAFWLGFFWSFTPSKLVNLAIAFANTLALAFHVPRAFGFTYVQTVLMTAFVSRDLLIRERKDSLYVAWSVLVNIPVVLMGWIEALGCDAGLINYGGHVFYDAVIPLSMLAYAAVALAG